ncbi:hypothetical protein [Xanthomonas arboricola]|nr:hypothetical protein [Xanthomonas arboricola]
MTVRGAAATTLSRVNELRNRIGCDEDTSHQACTLMVQTKDFSPRRA